MKVLNLQCQASHVFEGWFASEQDYASQLESKLLECPMCGDTAVHKLPSAPRLNFGASAPAGQAQAPAPAETDKTSASAAPAEPVADKLDVVSPEVHQALQAAWLQLARRIVAETVDVGERFSEEARRMHYGEAELRGIRGQATREETEALLDEGIEVMALPLPAGLKGPLQ